MLIVLLPKILKIVIVLLIAIHTNNTFAKVETVQSSVSFENIKRYATLANAAYHSMQTLPKSKSLKNYSLSSQSDIREIGISYFIANNDISKTQDIAVRGTNNLENTIANLALKLTFDKHTGIWLHSGFLQSAQAIYLEIKPQIKAGYTVNTTGHSMGGAVALILAMYLDSDKIKIGQVITFGQPKITNIAGSYKYQHLTVNRVVTPKDFVPLIPFLDPMDINDVDIYWHLGKEIILLPGINYAVLQGINSMLRATKFTQQRFNEDNFLNHKMTQYLTLLDSKIPKAELVPFKNDFNLFNLFGTDKSSKNNKID